MKELFAELRRRNVFKVGVAYAIVAWLLIEVASVIFPGLHLPDWTLTFLIIVILAGFPLALIFAWAFELTPEGLKREHEVDPAESITHLTGRKLDFIIIGLLAVAVVYFAVDKFVLEQAEVTTEQAPVAEPVAQERSIAVLPFANLSDDASNEYFSHGISEELLNALTRITSLRVASRTSSFTFKGTNTAIPEIAAQLNVNHILEGSVRKAGNRVRITVQLIDVESDSHLWSETYDRELDDIFQVQTDIALRVTEALEVTLLEPERRSLTARRTENLQAYDYYLLGRDYLGQLELGPIEQAIQHFRRAVETDSRYAQGYAGLAYAYAVLGGWEGVHPNDVWPLARAAAEEALALDEGLSEAHTALAMEAMSYRYDWKAAREGFERAIELNPSSVDALVWCALLESGIWRENDRAAQLMARAERLDPRSRMVNLNRGHLLLWAGRQAEAVEAFESFVALRPEYFGGHEGLAVALRAQGRYEEALASAQTMMDVADPNYDTGIGLLGNLYGRLGRRADALEQLERLDEIAARGRYVSPVSRAHVYAGLDEVDEAFAWLERSYEERSHWLIWLRTDGFDWRNLVSDPRYHDLVRRMNYPGSQGDHAGP